MIGRECQDTAFSFGNLAVAVTLYEGSPVCADLPTGSRTHPWLSSGIPFRDSNHKHSFLAPLAHSHFKLYRCAVQRNQVIGG